MKRFFVAGIGVVASWPFVPQGVKDFLMWPVATRVLGKGHRQVVSLKDGFKMIGSMEDILSRQILFLGPYRKRLWEPKTSRLLENLARQSQAILIAGAHMGYDVLLAARHTRGMVHAFEPVPALYKRAQENVALNPDLVEKIILTQSALGEKEGNVEFFVEDIRSSAIAYSGGHKKELTVMVPVTTIDTYAAKRNIAFDLILLDIEGYEWFALNGADKTLTHKPKLILEVSPKILTHTAITPVMIFDRLENISYTTTYLDRDKDYANIYAEPQ